MLPVRTTFNRTSMESKRATLMLFRLASGSLLIEPVWNRNKDEENGDTEGVDTLLIEPVWNRNVL